ncbi:hypothetical protein [Chitinophaga sp. MM2321]|uniref:hypothetical protein n=1 Tax=Chitinophaga sp. MM2321 TaxID=3137178 RepID=UPI0032D5B0BE
MMVRGDLIKVIRFVSLLFAGLTLGPGMAHLLAMPNKMALSEEAYKTVQMIYSGWAVLGVFQMGAILFSFLLLLLVRKTGSIFRLTLIALICYIAAMILFFAFTYPANQQTANWTVMPTNWLLLRLKWEYAHAVSAILEIIAFILLLLAALKKKPIKSVYR